MAENTARCKRALVTGATGYVGSNVVTGLFNQGWKVEVIVRPSSNLDLLSDIRNNISVHVFNGDMKHMLEIVDISSPDVVFHIASMVIGEHKPNQVQDLISSNVTFGAQLLEAMAANNIKNIVNTSTYWEHYENKEYSPVNLYGATKKAFRDILQYYVEVKDMLAITLELYDTYGPNDPRQKLLNLLLEKAVTGKSLAMSPGEQKVDLVHIDDVVRAYEVAAKILVDGKVEGHEVYGVASGQAVTLKELVAIFERLIGKKINIEWGGRDYRSREMMNTYNGYNRLPGWGAEISLESGMGALLSSGNHR